MQTILIALGVFGLLVIFHELGHFGVAKLTGIKVHEFAIGMGPRIFHHKGKETEYSIRILPIGGYVKMEGEDEASNDERSFNKKSIPVRIAVLVAGSVMNFILGILLFSIFFYAIGYPTTTIKEIIKDTPAEMAGILPGDRIVNIDGEIIGNWQELVESIGESEGKTMEFTIRRDEVLITKRITPIVNEETRQIMIGIVPTHQKSVLGAVRNSMHSAVQAVKDIIYYLRSVIAREATTEQLVGPVGIISIVGEASRAGWYNLVILAGAISINLGVMNLLPIPALDGSRILFLMVELLRGKPVDPDKEGMIHMVGFALLITLMLFVTWQDILRIFS